MRYNDVACAPLVRREAVRVEGDERAFAPEMCAGPKGTPGNTEKHGVNRYR